MNLIKYVLPKAILAFAGVLALCLFAKGLIVIGDWICLVIGPMCAFSVALSILIASITAVLYTVHYLSPARSHDDSSR